MNSGEGSKDRMIIGSLALSLISVTVRSRETFIILMIVTE